MYIAKTLSVLALHFPAFAGLALFRRRALPSFLRRLLVRLGPVYIKLGQVISTREDMLPQAYLDELSELRHNVPPESQSMMQAVLERAFPAGLEHVFVRFDMEPIAAGSVAQIYRARLRGNGETVAVKVLRPQVQEAIDGNFRFLLALVKFAAWISSDVRSANILGIVEEFRELLLTQTDLTAEAENLAEFGALFRNNKTVTVPHVYRELSSAEILVTDFVTAIAPYDYHKLDIAPQILAQRVDALLDEMVFIKGMCHADLHPGNFFWNHAGQIVLIDFGLVHRLSQIDRNHIMTFYFAIIDAYYDFSAEYFLRHFVTGWSDDREDSAALTAQVISVIHAQYAESGGRPRFGDIFNQLLRLLAQHRLQLTAGYSKIFLTLITVEGYLYALDPAFDMMENARRKRIEQNEYTAVPEEAERLVLGENGTYSSAKFDMNAEPQEAYIERNRFVLEDMLKVEPGKFLMDIGCGRGGFLQHAKAQGLRELGVTISRVERDAAVARGINVVQSSWEEFEKNFGDDYSRADYITIMEMLSHLGSLHENKVGLVEKHIGRLFAWLDQRLAPGGQLYIQELTIDPEFLTSEKYRADLERIGSELPWVGFTTYDQIIAGAKPYFDIELQYDHSTDLVPTYNFMISNIEAHLLKIKTIMDPELICFIKQQLHAYRGLSERGIVKLHRMTFRHRGSADYRA